MKAMHWIIDFLAGIIVAGLTFRAYAQPFSLQRGGYE